MEIIEFSNLADYLKNGREIEFSYNGKEYSITNHSGLWHLCDDTDRILIETICGFDEKDVLISKAATIILDDLTIEQIFDGQVYENIFIL